jgi:hypothetical protein
LFRQGFDPDLVGSAWLHEKEKKAHSFTCMKKKVGFFEKEPGQKLRDCCQSAATVGSHHCFFWR